MNKKNIFFIALLAFICIGTATTCAVLSKAGEKKKTNLPAAEANVLSKEDEKGEPAGGYFSFYGVDYPVYDPEQWTMINEELQKYEIHGKDLLNKLGVLTESQLKCTIEDVKKCLSELDVYNPNNYDANEYAVVCALNKVAGCFDYAGGSTVSQYVYMLSDGNPVVVSSNGRVRTNDGLIYVSGYGYNADGWTAEYIHDQEQLKAQKIKEETENNK